MKELYERAVPFFESGEKVRVIADKLDCALSTVSYHKKKWVEGGGKVDDAVLAAEKPARKPRAPKIEVEEDVPSEYEVPITVPVNCVDQIFAAFSVSEKMEAVRSILQERMDRILNPEGD